jgi:hypothetical protein
MVSDKFTLFLNDLSIHLGIDLHPDENDSCLLVMEDDLQVQLELDSDQTHLVIGSVLGELNPGKYREEVLKEALIKNAEPYPQKGIYAYSTKLNALILFDKVNLDVFNTENVLSILTPFVEKAKKWRLYLNNGQIPKQDTPG